VSATVAAANSVVVGAAVGDEPDSLGDPVDDVVEVEIVVEVAGAVANFLDEEPCPIATNAATKSAAAVNPTPSITDRRLRTTGGCE
jgi:hypothetical protein